MKCLSNQFSKFHSDELFALLLCFVCLFVCFVKLYRLSKKFDLDEFEMLEQAADDNISFCSEASLVVNVLQRAKKRKQVSLT